MLTDFLNEHRRGKPLEGSGGGHALTGNFLDFNSLKSSFLGLLWVIQTGYWPNFNLGSFFLLGIYLFMKTLTDFRKTVETGVDPRLGKRALLTPLRHLPVN